MKAERSNRTVRRGAAPRKGAGRPKRGLGQNFLVSRAVAGRIAGALNAGPGDLVIEIGPGRGALTGPLAAAGARVVAIELDRELALSLAERFDGRVEIVHGDIRDSDLDALAAERGASRYLVIGNIPYNLTSTILLGLAGLGRCERALLMVQREVGERILASPGERGCGILTVFLRSYFEMERVLRVKPGSFRPSPKVESVVIRFVPRRRGSGPGDREGFLAFLKGCFSQRRKQLGKVLREVLGVDPAGAPADTQRRPEELSLEAWFMLFRWYEEAARNT